MIEKNDQPFSRGQRWAVNNFRTYRRIRK